MVAALQVVWLVLAGRASDGFLYFCVDTSALSLRYGTKLPDTRLPQFMHAAGYGHVLLLERHSVALHPQKSDANAAQDMSYGYPHGGVCGHFIGVVPV